ncbi:H-2 class I histocompatibility antigen, Q10 alpha chain-like isoform X2 [Elgaria multicarinata webbii]|uniref:H-2 class I histocompatibility antigen, Q10 alpha chain-like isoform X2 n=1 Tax=Elgaria multicarinata webbii TaxID=159646 RepID=UPI002FCD55ED
MTELQVLGVAFLLMGGPGWAFPPHANLKDSSQSSPSSLSLRYFYTSVSEPGQGLPQFITVGYVDDQLFIQYDSNTKTAQPRTPWMEKVGDEDPRYWDRNTKIAQNTEQKFRVHHVNLRRYYNQTGGFHSLQQMYGCELRGDGSKGGYNQYGYDGRDYLALDMETLTWTAANTQAQISKRKREAEPAIAQRYKAYLEEECIEWLRRYLVYGKETLMRTEPPVVKVTHQASRKDLETLICQAHGFYPKEIDATWRRDGEIMDYETFRRSVAPNSDGTYHIWLSIEIDPKERDLYRCHVDHAGLPEPLVLAWEEPCGVRWSAIMPFITGAILFVLLSAVLISLTVNIIIRKKKMEIVDCQPNIQNYIKSDEALSTGSDSSEKQLLQ